MSVQTFHPAPIDQSATNWAVAQRIVGCFAPHAQSVPNQTIVLDAGHLLNGTTLIEMEPQTVGPFTLPTSNRVDRVVVDRITGVASVVTGTEGSQTPPAIPSGKLPVARVHLLSSTTQITNDIIVDERTSLDPLPNSLIVCRAHLNNSNQTGVAHDTTTKVNLSAADLNVGGAFDTATSRFKPTVAGYYLINAQIALSLTVNCSVIVGLRKNGSHITYGGYTAPVSTTTHYARVSDIIYLNGATDYIELTGYHNSGSTGSFVGAKSQTFFSAQSIG